MDQFLSELDLPSYPLGTEVTKAFIDPVGGVSFIQSIFEIPGMADRIMTMGAEIKECNMKYGEDPYCSCVEELKLKRDQIKKDVEANGILFNWDVFDNFWDKLPGD